MKWNAKGIILRIKRFAMHKFLKIRCINLQYNLHSFKTKSNLGKLLICVNALILTRIVHSKFCHLSMNYFWITELKIYLRKGTYKGSYWIELDQVGSNWIKLDQIGSNRIKSDQIFKKPFLKKIFLKNMVLKIMV